MATAVLPYLIFTVLAGCAAVLLTSRKLSEKFVSAGMLPRAFLGIVPVLQSAIRVFGVVLMASGFLKIAIDSGWIDSQLLYKYAFPGSLVLLGAILLLLNRRD